MSDLYDQPVQSTDDETVVIKKICRAAQSGGGSSDLPDSGVTAGSYTLTSLTVNAKGIITAAANGSAPATTPAGSSGQLQYNKAGAFGAVTSVNVNPSTDALMNATITGGTVVASTPVLNITQTWNNGAVSFRGITADFTVGADDFTSRLIQLSVQGNPQFWVTRFGEVNTSGNFIVRDGGNQGAVLGTGGLNVESGAQVTFSSSASASNSPDSYMRRVSAGIFSLGNDVTGTIQIGHNGTNARVKGILQTGSVGLSSGDWYVSAGVVMIVP